MPWLIMSSAAAGPPAVFGLLGGWIVQYEGVWVRFWAARVLNAVEP